MMNSKLSLLAGLLVTVAVTTACGDDTGTGTGGTGATGGGGEGATGATGGGGEGATGATGGGGSGGTGGMPSVPELGAQLDRFGRPAINTALNETFLVVVNNMPAASTDMIRGAAQDEYNKNGDPATWTKYTATMARQLGILDGLAGGTAPATCGSQLLACPAAEQGTKTNAECYGGLAGVLANDRMWLKPSGTSCAVFLGVEANATGVIPNDDCGGRRPKDDVIDTEYSVLAAGTVSGVGDGIAAPMNLHPETFPYMADPVVQ